MDTTERDEPTIGHNRPPLGDRIFSEPDADVASVLAAVRERIERDGEGRLAELSARAKALSSNGRKLPNALDESTAQRTLDLLADIGAHSERATEERTAAIAEAKALADALVARYKPMDAGIANLEKSLRPLLETYALSLLDAHNASLPEGSEPMASVTVRGADTAKATVTVSMENVVVDPDAVPRELCVPDQRLVDAAMERGAVAGVEARRASSLRVYK